MRTKSSGQQKSGEILGLAVLNSTASVRAPPIS